MRISPFLFGYLDVWFFEPCTTFEVCNLGWPCFFGEKGNFFTGGAAEKNFDIKAGGFLMMEKDSLCLR